MVERTKTQQLVQDLRTAVETGGEEAVHDKLDALESWVGTRVESSTSVTDVGECPECGSTFLQHYPPEYDGSTSVEDIKCEGCGTTITQTWKLVGQEVTA